MGIENDTSCRLREQFPQVEKWEKLFNVPLHKIAGDFFHPLHKNVHHPCFFPEKESHINFIAFIEQVVDIYIFPRPPIFKKRCCMVSCNLVSYLLAFSIFSIQDS